ncbi:pyridoxal-dependent decarboxylase [Ruminococcus sp.]|uniref:pyridoxal-dependent decarboxylase n=1 Tax=Ruminococcus sp. TaxID=41978 RepID=UPI0025DC86A1|nr:pyridoxal-dependent decarboxylase [Ruminococcus sp.]MCR4639492.1 pyridoxal-dependent decarboxylase [Ruminococcus sp.]
MDEKYKMQTPFYLIDKQELDSSLAAFKSALNKYWNNYIIGYSYKTNSLPWIIEYFKANGCFAEVVSDNEYELAKSIGIENNKIVYNGIIKSKETFLEAVHNKAIVNIDSNYEIEWLDELKGGSGHEIGIRVNFELEKYCPGQTQCGEDGGRFGFCYENGSLEKAIKRIEEKGVKVVGLHLHVSSKTRSLDIYRAIANMAVEIAKKYCLELKYVDVGGGFFGGLPNKPSYADYIELISTILSETFTPDKTKLIVEPGMSLIGAPISYVTSVIDIKDTTANRFVVTDGSRTNIDPLMSKKSYFYGIIKNDESNNRHYYNKQIISGFTCMEHDRLFELNDHEELMCGDKIVYDKVGAYTMCLTPLFIKYFPDVYVTDGEKITKVRNRWTHIEYKA